MEIALTDKDIENLCRKIHSNANIIFLPKMENINSLDEVFKGQDHCIMFVATNGEYNGHWQALFKTPNNIFFFDSYGHNFTLLLKKVFDHFGRDAYGESFKLGKLIADSDYFKQGKVVMNTKQYQKTGAGINTCGRHAYVAFMIFKELGDSFNFYKYAKFMNNYKAKNNLPDYDACVVKITNEMAA